MMLPTDTMDGTVPSLPSARTLAPSLRPRMAPPTGGARLPTDGGAIGRPVGIQPLTPGAPPLPIPADGATGRPVGVMPLPTRPDVSGAVAGAMKPAQGSGLGGVAALLPPTGPNILPVPTSLPPLPATAAGTTAAGTTAGRASPSGAVPSAPIDPTNDLRSRSVLPTDTPALTAARQRMIGADAGVAGFDRMQAIRDAMQAFGGAPDDVAGGPSVGGGPSEQGALETLNGQVSGAASRVAGFDRGAEMTRLREQLAQWFGDTDVSAGAAFDPGKDYTGDLNAADAATSSALSRVTGRDRTALTDQRRQRNLDYFGNTDLNGGAAIDAGPSRAGELNEADAMAMNAARRATGTDRTALARQQRSEFDQFLAPTALSARSPVNPTSSARLDKYGTMVDDAAGRLATVDRVQMAKDMLRQFEEGQLPEHELALRKATEKYAARGGGRSGMLRTEYGNLDLTRQRDKDLKERQLISQALEGSIADQFNKTSALSGLEGTVAAREASTRGEQRTERDYATGVDRENLAAQRDAKARAAALGESSADATLSARGTAFGTAQDLASSLANREQTRRANLGAERSYRTGIEESNLTRGLSTRANAANLAAGEADATMGDDARALDAARGVSSDLFGRQSARGANQRADRAFTTGIDAGNVTRRLSTRQAVQGAASGEADAGFGTASSALSSLAGLQGATAGREAGRRNELRTERDTATGLSERNVARRMAASDSNRSFASNLADGTAGDRTRSLGSARDLFGTLSDEGAATRAETRGERGYQNAMEQQSFERMLSQDQYEQSDQDRQLSRALSLLGAGEAGNPASILAALSASGGMDPQLIASLGQMLGRTTAGTTGRPNIPAGRTLPASAGSPA